MNDDGALAARVAAGDATAAEALVERYYDDILRYCLWHAPTPALAEDAAQAEWQSAWQLRQMVAALPVPQREVVLLRFGQTLTLREIAAVTGLPLRTVQSRLRAALKRLKHDYEKGEER